MIKKHQLFYIAGFVTILALAISVYFFIFRPQPTVLDIEATPTIQIPGTTTTSTPTTIAMALTETTIIVTPTNLPIATLPPPLANVEFPTQIVDYPPSWPSELHYPEQFSLVESGSGVLPSSDSIGWATKLRYGGQPADAAEILSSFFLANEWRIADHNELDTGGFLILIERGDKDSTGIIVIDRDPNDLEYTNIVATIFP